MTDLPADEHLREALRRADYPQNWLGPVKDNADDSRCIIALARSIARERELQARLDELIGKEPPHD